MITIFAKTNSSLSKKTQKIFAKYFGKNILKIITSVPDCTNFRPKGDCEL
jgi:hypothetical protein